MNFFLTEATLDITVRRWKERNLKIVLTNGCFDLLHVGHLHTFVEAKKLGDILLVGINSDLSIRRLKGEERPVLPEMDRAIMVSALKPVDYCIIFGEKTADRLLEQVVPAVYVKGGDYTLENLPEKETLTKFNIETVFVPLISGMSTTGLIAKINRVFDPTTQPPKLQSPHPGR